MTAPGVKATADSTLAFYLGLAVVGAFMILVSLFVVVSLFINLLIILVGSLAFYNGVILLFARLAPSQSAVFRYLTGGDPESVPRWVYLGLLVGVPAVAASFILFYYASYINTSSTAAHGTAGIEFYASVILLVIGGVPISYCVAFLRGYWGEG